MAENFVLNTGPKPDDGVQRAFLEIRYPDKGAAQYRFKVVDDFSPDDHEKILAFQEKASNPNLSEDEESDFYQDAVEFVQCVLYDPIDPADLRKLSFDNWKSLLDHLASRFV